MARGEKGHNRPNIRCILGDTGLDLSGKSREEIVNGGDLQGNCVDKVNPKTWETERGLKARVMD